MTLPTNAQPLDIPAAIEAALTHHAAGRLDHAADLYNQVLQADPQNADALHLLGVIAQQRGQHQQAIDLISRAIVSDPTFPGYHNNLGEAHRSLGQLDQAEKAYRQAIALDPAFPDPHSNLGMILQKRTRVDDAIDLYRKAIQLQPGFAEAYNNLGTALMAKALVSEGVAAYHKALQLKSDYADAYSNLAFALGIQGDYANGIECCRLALKQDPNHYEAYRHLAALYERLNDQDKAADAYRQALRCRPGSPEARYYLAAVTQKDAPPAAPADYVKLLFDNYAPSFDMHLTGALRYRAPQLIYEAILAAEPQGMLDILDLGCGTGLSGVAIRKLARSLVGVDLSEKMIEKATERKIYDTLLVADLTSAMQTLGRRFDAIVSSDVFVYIGDLAATFAAAAQSLRPNGLFVFSVEVDDQTDTYTLRPTRRYAHSQRYLRDLARFHRFEVVSFSRKALRTEREKNVDGWIIVLRAK
jgi:predicted TPR repeat methyltransferase